MNNILRIDSSLFSEQGVSHQLANELIENLTQLAPEATIISRDLSKDDVPHLDAARISAISTAPDARTEAQQAMVAYSDQLIAEAQAADALVIGAPMYNFSVPSVLKAWFDHIARAGVTFSYTSEGPKGHLENKTAYVITTRGGQHKDQPSDTLVPYVKNMLAFVGITDVRVIYAEGLNMGGGAREQGIDSARQEIQQALVA